jgi:glycosyltransferase involved in cell wall biosynthesis/SAM-dependent methyltransferase
MCAPKAPRWVGALWARTALYGAGMREALESEHQRFSTVHLCHYFGGSTHRLSGVVPAKTIIHPFIHDEPQLYHPVMRDLFAGSRGVICNSLAEVALAAKAPLGLLPTSCRPIGNGVAMLGRCDPTLPARRFRKRHLLYIGRLIPEKNLFTLIDWIDRYNNENPAEPPLELHMIGTGPLSEDPRIKDRTYIHCLGRLPEEIKEHYLRDLLALVQPSLLESFSLVMLEAWAQKTPVIVHADCLATRLQVQQASGGFAVRDAAEFRRVVDSLVHHMELAGHLGESGQQYALTNFRWDRVVARFLEARKSLLELPNHYQPPGPVPGSTPLKTVFFGMDEGTGPKTVQPPAAYSGVFNLYPMTGGEKRFLRHYGDEFYRRYEAVFRDGPDFGRYPESWVDYLEIAKGLGPEDLWVDVGAGAGQFLAYLMARGVPRERLFGVEPDLFSFTRLREVTGRSCLMLADEFLEGIPAGSLKVASMIHVIEHIPFPELCVVLKLIYEKLSPGGRIVLEFPYVNTLKTSGTNFWMDPTHIRPLVGETIAFVLGQAGFVDVEKRCYAPHLPPPAMDEMAAAVGSRILVEEIYGCQDVCYLGTKP